MESLIQKCKADPKMRYVTIRNGETDDIYFFRTRRSKHLEGTQTDRFWCGFVLPEESMVVLGAAASHRDINIAHIIVSFMQEKALNLDPPGLFAISFNGEPAKIFNANVIVEFMKQQQAEKHKPA